MPYIPKEHEKYNLLPFCRKNGGEVFSYDCDLEYKLSNALPNMGIIPYGYNSYEEFYEYLDSIEITDDDLKNLLSKYKNDIKIRNIKENWSIAKYIGQPLDGIHSLTYGQYYYFPCNDKCVEYEGIIDDEEFTSYMSYSLDKANWEIAEDPLGLLRKILR